MKLPGAGLALCLAAVILAAPGQPAHATDRATDERQIAAILQDLEQATSARDIPRMLRHASEDVVMVSKNGEIVVGKQALAGYLERMIGAVPSLKDLRSRVKQDGPPAIHGDVAVAYGRSEDEYTFTGGVKLDITTSWSAALVRRGTQWRIASLHFSFNLFDNPLLNTARLAAWLAAAGGLAGGLLAGVLGVWLLRRAGR